MFKQTSDVSLQRRVYNLLLQSYVTAVTSRNINPWFCDIKIFIAAMLFGKKKRDKVHMIFIMAA